ncbi:MAG: hypothetical protein R8G66_34490 [Cytophagales bacterium]|nr:hypothetical protein [Cytophagales bacterium]
MKNVFRILFLSILAACTQAKQEAPANPPKTDPYAHIADEKIRAILKEAIDVSGTIDVWRDLKEIRYQKHSVLYLSDGSEESNVIQQHIYRMSPEFEADISWERDGDRHFLQYTSQATKKFVNDTLQEANEEALSQSVMSAIYVLGMPFKLLDEGVKLTYEGTTNFEGFQAHAIEARYSSDENENHSTDDLWWYYFDAENTNFLGAMVYHAPTYALIRNLEFDQSTSIKFHKHRKSYRTDSSRNIEYLRAQFWYDNYEVR